MVLDHLKAVGPQLAAVLPQHNKSWYTQSNLCLLNFSIICMVLLSSANGYDGSLMNGLQALPQWQEFMHHPTGAWLGFVNAVQSLGAFLTFPAVAWSANRFGRKKTLFVAYGWLALGVILGTGAKSPAMFTLGRLFIGGVTSFFGACAPLLITETAYPTHRSIVTALYNTGWYVGSLLAAWVTYGTRNYTTNWAWKVPVLLQVLIPLSALPGLLIVPESPRWLVDQGRTSEARAFLVKYHAGGDENSPLVAFEMEEIERTIEMERASKTSTSYLDMLRTRGNRHRLLISVSSGIFAQWNGVGIVSYYLAPVLKTVGITSVTKQTLISGLLQVWNLIIAVSAAFTVDRLGRRFLFLVSCGGMLSCYIIISSLAGSFDHTGASATGIAVIPFLFIYYGFYDIAFTPLLFSYTCEIWPYQFRARGLAVMNISTQSAVFFNIFVNPIALEHIAWKYYVVYVVLLIFITITVYFFYPETNGHSLEEMTMIFDGPDATLPGDEFSRDMREKEQDATGHTEIV